MLTLVVHSIVSSSKGWFLTSPLVSYGKEKKRSSLFPENEKVSNRHQQMDYISSNIEKVSITFPNGNIMECDLKTSYENLTIVG